MVIWSQWVVGALDWFGGDWRLVSKLTEKPVSTADYWPRFGCSLGTRCSFLVHLVLPKGLMGFVWAVQAKRKTAMNKEATSMSALALNRLESTREFFRRVQVWPFLAPEQAPSMSAIK